MQEYYYVLLISILAGAIAGIIFSSRSSKKVTIRDAFIAAIIGATLTTHYTLMIEIGEINRLKDDLVGKDEKNALSLLEGKIKKKSASELTYQTFNNYQDKIEAEIENAIFGTIRLYDEDEVITEWKQFFHDAKSMSIKATNIIPAKFWLDESSFSVEQLTIQKDAIERDYTIQRIFLYKQSDISEKEKLKTIAEQHVSIGIQVRYLSLEKLHESVIFNKNKSLIFGTEDIVITDENVVLLTIPNPKTGDISFGYLSEDRRVVDAALTIYNELWKIADKSL